MNPSLHCPGARTRRLFSLALILLFFLSTWDWADTAQAASPGAVLAWGAGTNDTGSFPNQGQSIVPIEAQVGVTAIAAGAVHTVALKIDGSVVAWGYNDYGQTTVPVSAQTGVSAIAAGALHTVALRTNGSVVAWGYNYYGQTTVPVAAQSGVKAIAAGALHTVALKNDGSVVAWGFNGFDQTTVPVSAQSGITAIAARDLHTLALKNNGSVVAWGYNDYGQTTVPVAAQSGVRAIVTGNYHTVAIVSVPLDTRRSGNELILHWTVNATGFTLQSTVDLTPPAIWVDASAPVLLGAQWTCTNTITGGVQFYRLRKP